MVLSSDLLQQPLVAQHSIYIPSPSPTDPSPQALPPFPGTPSPVPPPRVSSISPSSPFSSQGAPLKTGSLEIGSGQGLTQKNQHSPHKVSFSGIDSPLKVPGCISSLDSPKKTVTSQSSLVESTGLAQKTVPMITPSISVDVASPEFDSQGSLSTLSPGVSSNRTSPGVQSPSQISPRVQSPIRNSPGIQCSSQNSPGIQSPIRNSPVVQFSSGNSPGFQSPSQMPPGVQSPIRNSPGFQSPSQFSPGVQSPIRNSPGFQSPSQISPGIQSPIRNSPGVQSPSRNSQGVHSPSQLSPGVQSPIRNSPVMQSPSRNSPGLHSPGVLALPPGTSSIPEAPSPPLPSYPTPGDNAIQSLGSPCPSPADSLGCLESSPQPSPVHSSIQVGTAGSNRLRVLELVETSLAHQIKLV